MRLSNRHAGFALSGGSAARRATRNSTGSVVIAGLINRIFAAMQCSNIPGGSWRWDLLKLPPSFVACCTSLLNPPGYMLKSRNQHYGTYTGSLQAIDTLARPATSYPGFPGSQRSSSPVASFAPSKRPLLNWSQPSIPQQIVPQRRAGISVAIPAAALQFWDDKIDELFEAAWGVGCNQHEAVGAGLRP